MPVLAQQEIMMTMNMSLDDSKSPVLLFWGRCSQAPSRNKSRQDAAATNTYCAQFYRIYLSFNIV